MISIYTLLALVFLTLISLGFNAYLIFKLKSIKKSRPESIELSEFLRDLMTSKTALLKVSRVDQSNLFLKSPRDI